MASVKTSELARFADDVVGRPNFLGSALGKIWAIATLTFRESVRKKVFVVLLLFAIVVISSSVSLPATDARSQFKVMESWCLRSITFFGVLIALFLSATSIPDDIEERKIFTVVTKPVSRAQYLLGKLLGFSLVLATFLVGMGTLSVGYLRWMDRSLFPGGSELLLARDVREPTWFEVLHKASTPGALGFRVGEGLPDVCWLRYARENQARWSFPFTDLDSFPDDTEAEITMAVEGPYGSSVNTIVVQFLGPDPKLIYAPEPYPQVRYNRPTVVSFDIRRLMRATTPAIDLSELKRPSRFLLRLKEGREPVARFLADTLPPEWRSELDAYGGAEPPPPTLTNTVLLLLNYALERPDLYEPARFDGLPLSASTRQWIAAKPQKEDLAYLNRRLLEKAFPEDLERSRPAIGVLDVVINQRVPQGSIGVSRTSVVLREAPVPFGFERNFFVSLLLSFAQFYIVLSLTLFFSARLSGPVSIFLGFFVYLTGSMADFLRSSLTVVQSTIQAGGGVAEGGHVHHDPDDISLPLLKVSQFVVELVLKAIPDLGRFDVSEPLLRGTLIPFERITGELSYAALYCTVAIAAGWAAVNSRELK
ncbi:MAG: ABC transporter permease subunit [Planctomycetes bacterium]|nr:ABC transporter permease subunit [Planctomycetota bacterium]